MDAIIAFLYEVNLYRYISYNNQPIYLLNKNCAIETFHKNTLIINKKTTYIPD